VVSGRAATVGLAFALASGACVPDDVPPRPLAAADAGTDARNAAETAPSVLPDNFDVVWPGRGCGQPLPPGTVATIPGSPVGYTRFSVMTVGQTLAGPMPARATTRTFWVRVPADYDPRHPYRVVYLGQGCGAFESANVLTYRLYDEAQGGTEQAIYVAIDIPTNDANMDCYDHRAGLSSQEWEAFQAFHDFVEAHYCVDGNRVFVAGYSTGGWLANMWGCYFGGIPEQPPRQFGRHYRIRGQAAVAGGEPAMQPPCSGPIASVSITDRNDNVNPISSSQAALSRVLSENGCRESRVAPWGPQASTCSQFIDCPATHPVIFCDTTGQGHSPQLELAIPTFTAFFRMMGGD
jgi:hypothetical protein